MAVAAQREPNSALADYIFPILNDVLLHAKHVAIAVSGGGDSMALLWLAQRYGARIAALTVDHGLRPESANEAQQVAAWCKARNIAHVILTPPMLAEANLPARARDMRYGALMEWCRTNHVPTLLVAHHADDQAETVALQQHRGDSPPSRSGMALVSARGGVRIVRPLLGVRKQALLDFLAREGQPWIEDPTNRSEQFARNRLRRSMDDAAVTRLWREAQLHGAQRHAQERARNHWVAEHARADANSVSLSTPAWRALPDAARTDTLSHIIRVIGGSVHRPRHHETARLDTAIGAQPGGKATLGHCLISWNADTITIRPEKNLPLPRGEGILDAATSLDTRTATPYMDSSNLLKQLASPPFWWFNYAPFVPMG